jgi:hypothetical protein
MPRGVKNAATTVDAVNGVEYDQETPGFDLEDDAAMTLEHDGRYKVITPRAVSFTAYDVRFVEGVGRTDDLATAERLKAEFKYRVIDTLKPQRTPTPIPEPLPEAT